MMIAPSAESQTIGRGPGDTAADPLVHEPEKLKSAFNLIAWGRREELLATAPLKAEGRNCGADLLT